MPNRRAQNFARQQTRNIIFLTELKHGVGFDNPHMFEILSGVENELYHKNYGLILRQCSPDELVEHYTDILCSEYVDGAIIHASVFNKDVAKILLNISIPYIVVGMPIEQGEYCYVDTNNKVAGQIAGNYLKQCGYSRISYIGGEREDKISRHRLEGVLSALDNDMPNEYIFYGQPTSRTGSDGANYLMNLNIPPNAIICANQYLAYGCVRELEKLDIDIPNKMGIITFDDFPFSKVVSKPLTVVNLDMYELGMQAAKLVLRRIKKPELLVQSQMTAPKLIERESTINTGGIVR